jgi:amino acid transporter
MQLLLLQNLCSCVWEVIVLIELNQVLWYCVSVFGIFVVYTIVNFSLIVLRYSKPHMERPLLSPFKLGKFPILGGSGLVISMAMLFRFNITTVLAGVSLIVLSVALYMILKWRKNRFHTSRSPTY